MASGNTNYDSFYFDFYNKDGFLMFGIEFDNYDIAIYRLDSTNYYPTGTCNVFCSPST